MVSDKGVTAESFVNTSTQSPSNWNDGCFHAQPRPIQDATNAETPRRGDRRRVRRQGLKRRDRWRLLSMSVVLRWRQQAILRRCKPQSTDGLGVRCCANPRERPTGWYEVRQCCRAASCSRLRRQFTMRTSQGNPNACDCPVANSQARYCAIRYIKCETVVVRRRSPPA